MPRQLIDDMADALENVLPVLEDITAEFEGYDVGAVEPYHVECDVSRIGYDADLCDNWQCQEAGCIVLKIKTIRVLLERAKAEGVRVPA